MMIGPVALVLVALVAAGCGSSRKQDTSGATSPTTVGNTTPSSFGDVAPCGKGSGGGATDVGVTSDAITIGYGDDAGFRTSPGLNQEMSDAVKALVKWCNDQGGINGRQVKANYYDAKITEVNNAMTQACTDKVFMLVGEGWALDAAQEQIRLGCKLPAFPAYAVSAAFANGPLMIAAVPNPVDEQPVSHALYYAKAYPEKAKKLAFMYANYSATEDTATKSKASWPKVGFVDIKCDQIFNIAGEADWKPFVQKLKDCGAQVVDFVGSPAPGFENVLEAANQLDYHPDWLVEANFYDQNLAKWNTSGFGDHVFARLQDVPLEYASQNKATQTYLDLLKANGGHVSDLGIHAASAFLLWATEVKACGADVTRQCVLDHARQVHDWTGGGLSGRADVGTNTPSTCEAVVTLKGTHWTQINPNAPATFDCNPDNVQKVTGAVVDKAQLGADRIVHKNETP